MIPNLHFPCIQVNLNKSNLASALLVNGLIFQDSIAFITEPYVAYDKVVSMPKGYSTFPSHAIPNGPRAALSIPKILSPIALDHLSCRDCAAALLQCNGEKFLAVSAYLDINLEVVPDWLSSVVSYSDEHNYPLLLCMDSNAHSQFYSDRQNHRGDLLEEFIVLHGLSVANFGNTPTFQTFRASSQIDVTLYREILVTNWRVSTLYNASDHHSVLFSIKVDMEAPRDIRPWHSADWKLFHDTLDMRYTLPSTINKTKLDRLVAYMYRCIELALDRACPSISIQPQLKGNIWFTDRLFKQNLAVKKQYDRALSIGSLREKAIYKRLHRDFKKACRKAKSKSWRKFVSETENEKNMAFLAKISLHNDRRTLNLLENQDGDLTSPGLETLQVLANAHFPTALPLQEAVVVDDILLRRNDVLNSHTDFVTNELTRAALLKFKPMKAPGPDGLKPIIFKHLPLSFISLVTFIYKACLCLRYTPKLWTETKIIWLPKPDKDSYVKAKSFRPIALSNFFLKGLERLITWRMESHLVYYPIHAKQHGFTKGKSTEGALSNTVNYIEKFIFRNKHCLGLFLDIKSAYDSMDIDHIRTSLYLHGGEDDLVEWYYNYLSTRVLRLDIHGDVLALRATTGFPQGGVASAKFWLIAFNPAIEIINTQFIEGNGYADDCSAVFGGREPEVLVTRLQRILDSLVHWGSTCNLSFNAEKSVVMFFTRTQETCDIPLTINGRPLQYVQVVRYLGIFLDPKLYWTAHVDTRVVRSKRFLLKMAAIAKLTWGPKPKLMRWMYTCMVRPMVLYGSVVWAHEAGNLTIPDKLRRINRLAITTCAGFLKSTPTRALEIMLDIFPLHLYAQKEALCAFMRLLPIMQQDWTGYNRNIRYSTGHRRFWYDLVERYDLTEYANIDSCFFPRPQVGYSVVNESFQPGYVQQVRADWSVFTDGSKMNGRVGTAFVIVKNDTVVFQGSVRLSDHASVFQAELIAIKLAAECMSNVLDVLPVDFYSDSQSALQALRQDFIESIVLHETVTALGTLTRSVNLFWVRAHNGNFYNEMVDTLAKDATNHAAVELGVEISRKIIRNEVLLHVRSDWDLEWVAYPEARMSRMFFPSQHKGRAKEICCLSRYQVGRLMRVTTGHNQLMYFQFVVDPLKNPTCRFCGLENETFYHWVQDCPAFQAARQWFFADQPSIGDCWDLQQLLAFAAEPRVVRALAGRPLPGFLDPVVSDQESVSQSQDIDDPDNLSDMDFNSQGNYFSDMSYDSDDSVSSYTMSD